jgi:hypothetical protein
MSAFAQLLSSPTLFDPPDLAVASIKVLDALVEDGDVKRLSPIAYKILPTGRLRIGLFLQRADRERYAILAAAVERALRQ